VSSHIDPLFHLPITGNHIQSLWCNELIELKELPVRVWYQVPLCHISRQLIYTSASDQTADMRITTSTFVSAAFRQYNKFQLTFSRRWLWDVTPCILVEVQPTFRRNWLPQSSGYKSKSSKKQSDYLLDSKGFWRWFMTYRIIESWGFFHRPVFYKTEGEGGRHLLSYAP
jgi:hypothetical protein